MFPISGTRSIRLLPTGLVLVPKQAKWATTISKSTCNKGFRPRSLGRARCTSARSVAVGAHFLSSTFRDFVTPTSLILGLVALSSCSSMESSPSDALTGVGNAGSTVINTAGTENFGGVSGQMSVIAGASGGPPIAGLGGSGGGIPTVGLDSGVTTDGGLPTAGSGGSGAGITTAGSGGSSAGIPTAGSGVQSPTAGEGENDITPIDGCVVSSIPDDIRSAYQIDDFYQKYASANGVIVATSPKVGDDAIIKDCQLLLEMYSNDTLRESITSQKFFFTLIAESEQLSSLPEIPLPIYDLRARGLGSMIPTICAEDSIMCMPGDPWIGDCICPHEYGHTLADIAIGQGDPARAGRLAEITSNIRASGRLAGAYVWQDGATSGMIAWGVQAWYNCAIDGNRGGYHSDINTREELKTELPDLYDFLAEILPEDSQYVDCYDASY